MSGPADLILTDADVWTGDAARRWVNAIAIRGDRLVAVGTTTMCAPCRVPRPRSCRCPDA